MFHIVLVNPEIPPNTGNVIRLAANTGSHLHLVEPLGFTMDDRQLKRAGLDYHELSNVEVHPDWNSCRGKLGERRMFALSTRATRRSSSYGVPQSARRASNSAAIRSCPAGVVRTRSDVPSPSVSIETFSASSGGRMDIASSTRASVEGQGSATSGSLTPSLHEDDGPNGRTASGPPTASNGDSAERLQRSQPIRFWPRPATSSSARSARCPG